MARNTFRPIANSGIWKSISAPTHTRLSKEPDAHIYYSLCFTILSKIRGEIFLVSLWYNSLITIPSYPRYRFCSLSSFPCSGIPVIISHVSGQTMIDTVTPSGPWEYLSIAGGANPISNYQVPWHTFSKYLETTVMITQLRVTFDSPKVNRPVRRYLIFSWSKDLSIHKHLHDITYNKVTMRSQSYHVDGSIQHHCSSNNVLPLFAGILVTITMPHE